MKKIVRELIIIMIVSCCISRYPDVCQAAKTSVPSGYTPIYTIEDLYGINDNLSGKYILMNDIDLSETKPSGEWDTGSGWVAIGKNESGDFNGIFDGNGYTIKNLSIYSDPEGVGYNDDTLYGNGLFYAVGKKGIVKNIGLDNIDINFADYGRGGSIADHSYGIVENCFVTGKINVKKGIIGGLVATLYDGEIKNCYSSVSITCVEPESYSKIGGIVGEQKVWDRPIIKNCYFNGIIKSEQEYYAGPIVGDYNNGALIWNENNYYSSRAGRDDSIDKTSAKAVKLSPAQMKSQKCFTGFDFKKTWVLDKNSSYPYPQLKDCMQVKVNSIELLSAPKKLKYTTSDKIDFTGSELQIRYEDGYTTTTPLTEEMVTYEMKVGTQTVDIDYLGQTDEFEISVSKAKESLTVTAKKTKLKVGVAYTYKVKYVGNAKVSFESTKPSVLKINKNTGKAVAKKKGTATIIIRAGTLSKKIGVTVV